MFMLKSQKKKYEIVPIKGCLSIDFYYFKKNVLEFSIFVIRIYHSSKLLQISSAMMISYDMKFKFSWTLKSLSFFKRIQKESFFFTI